MAFPSPPYTWPAGHIVLYTEMNAQVRDALRYLKGLDGDVQIEDDIDLMNHYLKNVGAAGAQGQILYHDGTGFIALAPSSGKYLKSQGAGANPLWATVSAVTTPGDGSDGSVTISANTDLTRDMFYSSLTVNTTITLNTKGYRIFCSGTITNNGTIANKGTVGTAASAGAACAAAWETIATP